MNTRIHKTNMPTSCGSHCYSRRTFLTGCAKCLGAGAFSGLVVPSLLTAEGCTSVPNMKIRVFFVLMGETMPIAGWPNIGYDYRPGMEEITNALNRGCSGIDFVYTMVELPEKVKEIVDTDAGNIDGYIVVQMMCRGNRALNPVVESGKPVLFTDFLYCGSAPFLTLTATHLRTESPNFAFISPSRTKDLVEAARCFKLTGKEGNLQAFVDGVTKVRHQLAPSNIDLSCIADKIDLLSTKELLEALKGKKLIEIEGKTGAAGVVELKQSLGIEIVGMSYAELNHQWEIADRDRAMDVVRHWKSGAADIIDVTDETLEKSARMYLAEKACLQKHGAEAITIGCLPGFYRGDIPAYPCLGFHELLNEGFVGACENDTRSTITMLAMTTLTKGRPGFISDPVIDSSTKQIIYAHCVAASKQFGPAGQANPFTIMTHSEDRQGASVRSTMPLGYMTTTLEMSTGRKEILFHQAKAVANSTDDRACRTKLGAVPIGDMDKLHTKWDQWGWHRVTFYGDLKEPVYALADALGWKVIEEA